MKIAIIGAGICGTYLAKNLAQKGNNVTVFEKKNTIGKECCSGLFSARLLGLIPEAKPLAQNLINRCVIHFPKKDIRLKFRQPFFVIEHRQLDLLMAAMAVQAGADIRVGGIIDSLGLAKIEKEYDRVIGCDGALSPTRAYLGLKNPNFLLGMQGFEKKRDNSDFVETWATKNGFFWKIPRNNDVEWGIMEKPEIAPGLFNEFIAQKKLSLAALKSAIIPQGLAIPKNERVTLCGDASGLTKPWSGGGVVWNLAQARILLKNFPNLLQYRKEANRFFRFEIAASKSIKKLVYRLGFDFPALIPGNCSIEGDFLFKF